MIRLQIDGITFFSAISKGSVEDRKIQDAFFSRLVHNLKRRDKTIPIFIWDGQFQLFPIGTRSEWFATISYDTLRSPDPMFIEDYFYYRMGSDNRAYGLEYSNPPSIKYQIDLPEPIDLSNSYDTSLAPIGLKIMYDYAIADSTTGFERLYTLVQYATDHLQEIKANQRRIVLPYPITLFDSTTYKPQVSILTIDTNLIRNIPLQSLDFDPAKLNESKAFWKYIFWGAFIILMAVIFIWRNTVYNIIKSIT